MPGRRILVVAPRYPHPPHRGDQVRVFHVVRQLAKENDVTVVSFGSGPPLPFDGVRAISVDRGALSSLAANVTRPSPALPAQIRMFLDRRMASAVAREAARDELDVVHVTLARMAPYMPPPRPGLHRHLDLVDTLSLNMRERARGERPGARWAFRLEARLMERYERRIVAAADSASVVTESDRDALTPGSVAVVPNGVDSEAFRFAEPSEAPPVATFFGNLGYFHNVEPARYAAERVMPLLRARVPDASLRIVGARPAARVRGLAALEGVSVLADVEDMAAELHRASVALLPVLSGSGIKNKVLEAFSAGLPVVTTTAGIDGIDGIEPGRHCYVGDDPESLADAAAALLGSLPERRRVAAEASALVTDRYSWKRQARRLLDLYAGRGI